MDVTYTATVPENASEVLIPGGIETPYGYSELVAPEDLPTAKEAKTGQRVYRLRPPGDVISLTFKFTPSQGAYPDEMFVPHPSRYTRFADDLVTEVEPVGADLTGVERARAIACHVAERFTYGHTDQVFNDGLDEVPALGCGLTTGSCVDINTYFIAALRAAGIKAGYITGFFFPEEKKGSCEDGHCWVVTRINGETHEWDIAHHLKMGSRDIHPGLNPKPGHRVACFHSMGLDFPEIGIQNHKAILEPAALVDGRVVRFEAPVIQVK